MNRARILVMSMALSLVVARPAAVSANCGAEGCPLASRGPEAGVGRFSFSVGYQAVEQDRYWQGDHPITADQALQAEGGFGHILEQYTSTRTARFNAEGRLTRRLGLSLSLPWVERVHRHALAHHAGFFVESQWNMQGPGDGTAIADWTVLDGSRPGAGVLAVQVGVKLPTGRTRVEEIDGEAPEPPARPGTGSTDGLVGLHYRRLVTIPLRAGRSASFPLTASASARYNGSGTLGYRMGNEWDASVGTSVRVARGVSLLAQLNATVLGRDEPGNTDAAPHNTGGSTLFASPGLMLQVVPGMSAFGYWQLRLHQQSSGLQLVSPYHLIFGLSYAVR